MFTDFNENSKPSSKVLRPPGGGTSDIFGGEQAQTPRNVKNHMQSNIFSCEKSNNGDQPRRGQKNMDSYTRLFGEPEPTFTPGKNHMKSNIPFGNADAAKVANGNGHHDENGKRGSVSSTSSGSVSSSTENLKNMNGASKTDGHAAAAGQSSRAINDGNGATQVINKNRVPPGGFSSGLW